MWRCLFQKKQKDIAKEFGVSEPTIKVFKNALNLISLEASEIKFEALSEQDMEFLLDYTEFSPILYNIWNQSKAIETTSIVSLV